MEEYWQRICLWNYIQKQSCGVVSQYSFTFPFWTKIFFLTVLQSSKNKGTAHLLFLLEWIIIHSRTFSLRSWFFHSVYCCPWKSSSSCLKGKSLAGLVYELTVQYSLMLMVLAAFKWLTKPPGKKHECKKAGLIDSLLAGWECLLVTYCMCSRAGASFIEQKCQIIGDDSFISDFLSRFCKELLNRQRCLVSINCLSWPEVSGNLLFKLFWTISSLIYGISFLSFSHSKETKRVLRTLCPG